MLVFLNLKEHPQGLLTVLCWYQYRWNFMCML